MSAEQPFDRLKYETDVERPDLQSGSPRQVWDAFFEDHRPAPQRLGKWVLDLHNDKQYEQVIACLQSALIHGQAQPWMYEVLALTMEIKGYPKASVERVVLSLTDFGRVDYESMMYSGAYLARFDRKASAMTMYRQASRILPDRHEPYVLGLKLAREAGSPDDVQWAASGVLLNYWESDYRELHRKAEDALLDQIQNLKKAGETKAAERLAAELQSARSHDLVIRLDWNGDADLDLYVEEPSGSVCSPANQQTQGGGLYLHDGIGPQAENAFERYVCPRGMAGPYRVTVKQVLGNVVGDRVTVTVTQREGLDDESQFVRTLPLHDGQAALTVDVPLGRRTQPRIISWQKVDPLDLPASPAQRHMPNENAQQAARVRRDFLESRTAQDQQSRQRRAGAVGYAPVIQVVPEGSSVTGRAVVSPDRRYIRLGIQPTFSSVTDVFTFSYLNGGQSPSTQPNAP